MNYRNYTDSEIERIAYYNGDALALGLLNRIEAKDVAIAELKEDVEILDEQIYLAKEFFEKLRKEIRRTSRYKELVERIRFLLDDTSFEKKLKC